jgi:hypothetical protein
MLNGKKTMLPRCSMESRAGIEQTDTTLSPSLCVCVYFFFLAEAEAGRVVERPTIPPTYAINS